MEEASLESGGGRRRDPRLLIALAGAAALAAIVAAVALTGGSGDDASAAAPAHCLERWNDDPEARAFGRHNYGAHGYERVQVTELTEEAEPPTGGADGLCAVIFGALELDTEPVAAGQLLLDGVWEPISLRPAVELTRVAELQAIAAGQPNASLTGEGVLVAYGDE